MHNRIAEDGTPADAIARRLYAAAWGVGKIAVGSRSLVTGTNGENCVHAAAGSQAAVSELAVRQAEAAGARGSGLARGAHAPDHGRRGVPDHLGSVRILR
jgi:hypothetical protein